MPRSRQYTAGLYERLRDPQYAAAYLNAAKEESQEVFLQALRDVAESHKISKVASAARVNRESLYRTLSAKGNPTLATFTGILEVLGLDIEYHPQRKHQTKHSGTIKTDATARTPVMEMAGVVSTWNTKLEEIKHNPFTAETNTNPILECIIAASKQNREGRYAYCQER